MRTFLPQLQCHGEQFSLKTNFLNFRYLSKDIELVNLRSALASHMVHRELRLDASGRCFSMVSLQ